jgi:hypothetical protein
MVWQCRLVEFERETSGKSMQVGDMFFAPTAEEVAADEALPEDQQLGLWWPYAHCKPYKLSPFYKANNAHRRPLLIFMPGRVLWCVDGRQFRDGNYLDTGWVVRGEAPNITVFPSVDMGSIYHGFIQNGIIQDDVSGGKYDDIGRRI